MQLFKKMQYHTHKNEVVIQFHWQCFITNPGFWLVNILFLKLNILSKKEMKMIKRQIFMKNKNKYQKS